MAGTNQLLLNVELPVSLFSRTYRKQPQIGRLDADPKLGQLARGTKESSGAHEFFLRQNSSLCVGNRCKVFSSYLRQNIFPVKTFNIKRQRDLHRRLAHSEGILGGNIRGFRAFPSLLRPQTGFNQCLTFKKETVVHMTSSTNT